jgi:hypothetical protein
MEVCRMRLQRQLGERSDMAHGYKSYMERKKGKYE